MNDSNSPQFESAPESGRYAKGVAVAIVTQNKDDEGLCRVKVRYPWLGNDSYWARLALPMAGKDRGWVLIPEVGDEVLVAFEHEDIRFPYVLGALWNDQAKPPHANGDGKNDVRTLVSRKHHMLLLDDGTRGVVELAHEKGGKIVFDDDGFIMHDAMGNRIKVNSHSGAMTIEAKGHLNIRAASISIEATGALVLEAGATLTMRGSMVNIN